jgi:short-subunit dehydrogenase
MTHAVITGGADGIGRALCEAYARAGFRITIVDRDAQRAEALCQQIADQGGIATFLQADLRDPAAAEAIVVGLRRLPAADVVVFCAGISAVGRFVALDLDAQQAVIDINLRAPIQLSATILREALLAPQGSLVFLASLSVFMGYPGAAAYAASKDGIASYARSLRVALARRGQNVLTVFPGPTRTAHARRYSPDNRREARRMPPEQLAQQIIQAVQRRQAILIPGFGNRMAALLGRVAPRVAEYIMKRGIFDKLP